MSIDKLYKFREGTSTLELYSTAHLKDIVTRLHKFIVRITDQIRYEEPETARQYRHWLELRSLAVYEIGRVCKIIKSR